MLLTCPHCETQFQVAANVLGSGRTVRCAQCKGSWFATPEPAVLEPVMAEAESAAEDISFDAAPANSDWSVDDSNVEAPSEVESPPISVDMYPEISISDRDRTIEEPAIAKQKSSTQTKKVLSRARAYKIPSPVVALTCAIGIVVILLLAARESIVRLVPDLAGIYAGIGMPVNLRGLEFRGVKTTQEMQDGIPVLVISGEVANVTRHPVEVPRVRIAVLGSAKQELYSWTTLLQRSILADNEKVAFRSRLASPPPEGQEVLVRFLTRSDITGSK